MTVNLGQLKHTRNDKGQTVVEYVLVVVIIVLLLLAAFQSAQIDDAIELQAQKIQNTMTSP